MITKFKLFEEESDDTLRLLVDQLDSDYIDDFFEHNFKQTAEDIIEQNPKLIYDFVDDDSFVNSYIEDEISQQGIDEFDEDDYKKYLENNITDNKEEKILKIYNKKTKSSEEYYDSDMLKKLTEKQLKKIIEDDNEEEEFVSWTIHDRYDDSDAQEILENIYGSDIDGSTLYNILRYYIEDEKIVEDYENEQDKFSIIQENIPNNKELQEKLIELDKANVLLLAQVFEPKYDGPGYSSNMGEEYDFQKLYIEEYVKANGDNRKVRATALKFLNDKFSLDDDIKEEFKADLWLITTKKYRF